MNTRVVIADDHDIIRVGLRHVLTPENGVDLVGEASDGNALLELVQAADPEVAIVDISMPGGDGIMATSRIATGPSRCRVIALSVHQDLMFIDSMLQAGALGYVLKDRAARDIPEAIRTVMSGACCLSPDLREVVVDRLPEGKLRVRPASRDPALTALETQVLRYIADGMPTRHIGIRLSLSTKAVDYHRRNIMRKTDLWSVAE